MREPKDYSGHRFYKLVLIEPCRVKNRRYWKAICDCGKETVVQSHWVTREKQPCKSCGCLNEETRHLKNFKHGHGADGPEQKKGYHSWLGLKDRCLNTKDKQWSDYGGRGIKVCKGIANDYLYFLSIVGEKKEKTSIDRIDNDKHYSCGKCDDCNENDWKLNIRWATSREQSLNRRNTERYLIGDDLLTPIEIQEKYNVDLRLVWSRYQKGYRGDELIHGKEFDTLAGRLNQSNPHKLKYVTVQHRLKKGMTFEEAISFPAKGKT